MQIRNILWLFILLLPGSIMAQIREGSYQAFKIDKDNTVETITVNVVPLGNGMMHFHEGDPRKPLIGNYRIMRTKYGYYTGNFKKGTLDGDWEWYEDDKLFEKTFYKNGLIDGKQIRYTRGTEKESYVLTYKDGRKQHFISYHSDGSVEEERFYDDKGYLHGEMFTRDPNGNITHENRYQHGKQEGRQVTTRDGLKTIYEVVGGKRNGKYTVLYPNGNKSQEGTYENQDTKTGKWTAWNEDGTLKSEEHYVNDELDGEKRVYFADNKLKSVEEYTAGKLNGKKVEYDEAPHRISRELSYSAGKLHGEFKVYHDGVLWREGKYQNGDLVYEKEYTEGKLQIVKLLDESGTLVNVEKYDKTGKRTYKNTNYKKHSSVSLKESSSGVIDIEIE